MQTGRDRPRRTVQWYLWRGWCRSGERHLNKINEAIQTVHQGDQHIGAIKQQLRYSWYKASNEVKRTSNSKAAEWEARCRVWTALIHRRTTQPHPERDGKRGGSQPRGGRRRRAERTEAREAYRIAQKAARGMQEEIMGIRTRTESMPDCPFPKGLLISTKYPAGPWIGDDMREPAVSQHVQIAVLSAQGQLCSRKSVSGQTSRMDRFVGILRAKFIDVLIVPEPGCQLFQAKAALRNSAWAEHGVQAFGPEEGQLKVLALVAKRMTAGIQGVGTAMKGRLVHLRWATGGDQLQIACVYSKAGAM